VPQIVRRIFIIPFSRIQAGGPQRLAHYDKAVIAVELAVNSAENGNVYYAYEDTDGNAYPSCSSGRAEKKPKPYTTSTPAITASLSACSAAVCIPLGRRQNELRDVSGRRVCSTLEQQRI
jgi:hypothetical protein